MTSTLSPQTFTHRYGDTETVLTLPLPVRHSYTKGQQDLVDTVIALGWTLDPTAVHNTYGWGLDRLDPARRPEFLVQHPFTFVKVAADGGTWTLVLDYVSREYSHYGRRGFSKTLKGAKLTHTAADGTQTRYPASLSAYIPTTSIGDRGNSTEVVLEKQSTASYAATNWIWQATRDEDGGYTLRTQVERLATNPELVLWIAAELQNARKVREAEAEARRKADDAAKARPLAPSWGTLRQAARDIVNANGKSDAVALLEALKAAVALVEEEVVVH
jgi:hypothetical protein